MDGNPHPFMNYVVPCILLIGLRRSLICLQAFLKMENDVITTSPTKAANDFPEGWHSEKFTVVDGRRGLVGGDGSSQ